MVGKVSERVLLREGLERTDNNMKLSSWPEIVPINQKNYYTEYMKREDQILALRSQDDATRDKLVQSAKERDRALNQNSEVPTDALPDEGDDTLDESDPSKIIVIHPGSQNLRIGFASDALPKTVPMVIGYKWKQTESDEHEAQPRRQFEAQKVDQQYGEEWSRKYKKMSDDLKADMRVNKRKVLPNSKELVANYNRRTEPEVIPQHNDPLQIEWTDVAELERPDPASNVIWGQQALRVPDDSDPKVKLWWPLAYGHFNEEEYDEVERLYDDFEEILELAIRHELGLTDRQAWKQYSCVFVVPDLYDKKYVENALKSCMSWFQFNKVCFYQESMCATFGAGYTQACVVDIGAQKTSICCVEDGLCIEDSRVYLKLGGFDVTETFVKMMLYDHFPYQDINLRRRYDFLLAEELKQKHCTLSQAEISVQLCQFHLRAPNKPTHKYQFKTYDEVILAPLGFFDPSIFDNSMKLRGRRKLIDRSCNAYDVDLPDDPSSAAQFSNLADVNPALAAINKPTAGSVSNDVSTPSKERSNPLSFLARETNGTPATSNAPSPAPEGSSTPAPFIFSAGKDKVNGSGSPAPSATNGGGTPAPQQNGTLTPAQQAIVQHQPPPGISVTDGPTAREIAAASDAVLPVLPIDRAIMTSIFNCAGGELAKDSKRVKELAGSIMLIGGGAKTPNFASVLEERLKKRYADIADRILVSRSARDMDEQVVVWKGASVFAKLSTNDSWVTSKEYERLGARILHHKVLWQW